MAESEEERKSLIKVKEEIEKVGVKLNILSHFLISFVFLALSCMSYLYILEINPLSVVSLPLFSPILRVVFSPCI